MGLENLKRRLYNKISPQRKYQLEKENRPIQNAIENAFTLGLYCPRPPRPAPPARRRGRASRADTFGSLVLCLGPEQFSVREACYFLTVSMTTVGYGDVSPTTKSAKLFMMIYILIGLAVCLPIAMDAGAYVHTHLGVFLMKLADTNPDDNRSPQWVKGVLAVVEIVLPILFGTGYFVITTQGDEECAWGKLDALWWTFMTVTTVGYGDLSLCHPKTDMVFLIFFVLSSVVFVTAAITTLSKLGDDIRHEAREAELLASFNIDMIKDLDTDGDGVDKNEYVLGMLAAMGHLDDETILKYKRQFDEYDADGSGKLTKDDLDLIDAKYKASAEASRSKVGRDLSMSEALERAALHAIDTTEALLDNVEDKLEAAEETIVKAGKRMTGASETDIVEAMEKKKERKARKKERKAAKRRAAAAADNRAADAFCCLNPEMPADDAAARV